jgi:hypothetical protein
MGGAPGAGLFRGFGADITGASRYPTQFGLEEEPQKANSPWSLMMRFQYPAVPLREQSRRSRDSSLVAVVQSVEHTPRKPRFVSLRESNFLGFCLATIARARSWAQGKGDVKGSRLGGFWIPRWK